MLYGLTVWGSTFQTYLKEITTLQNKEIKFIEGAKFYERVTPFYNNLKILKLADLFKFEIGKLVHAKFRNQLPNNLTEFFTATSQVSKRRTRSSDHQKK